jgi:hypothetical protein
VRDISSFLSSSAISFREPYLTPLLAVMPNFTSLARQATITLAQRENNDFGPAARGRFDFTILFEDVFLSIVPSVLLLLIGPPRLWALYQQPLKVKKSPLHESKLVRSIAQLNDQD